MEPEKPWSFRYRRRRLQVWREAVASCGLKVTKTSLVMALRLELEARVGSKVLRIESSHHRVAVVLPVPPDFHDVWIGRSRTPDMRKIEIGDELFDSRFSIEGPIRLLCILLDAKTRRLLLGSNVEDWLEINGGALRLETSDENLRHLLPLVLYIGRRLTYRLNAARCLAENARYDPEAGVRLQNLRLLIEEHPGKRATLAVLREACSDPSPEIRLRAARERGAQGRSVLQDLAESLMDDALSAEAVSALDRELPFERARAILGQALDKRRLRTAHACLEVLGKSGDPAAVEVLAEVMAREDGKLAAAAALALGATGSPAVEPPLLLALQREDTRVAAANALARTGTAAAVLPLEEAAESAPEDKDLGRATHQAIAEIQSRLSLAGVEAGQLSLAQSEAGHLSLAPAEAGRLALVTDHSAGQLSLAPAGPGEDLKPGGAA